MKRILITIVISLLAFTYIKDVNASTLDVEKSAKTVFVLGIEDGGEYDDFVRVLSNANEMTLNGEPFKSGTEVSLIGYYVLECYDEGEVVETIEFTIIPRFVTAPYIKIMEGEKYLDRIFVGLLNEGEFYIDGEHRPSKVVTITSIGNHTITVVGVNGYVKEINFTLEPSQLDSLDGVDYGSDIEIDTEKYENFTLNGYEIYGVIAFEEYGTYIIGIDGVNGYHREFEVNITLSPRYLEDGEVFTSKVKIQLREAKQVILDNRTISGGYRYVNEIGNHSAIYFGKFGQYRIYNFTIEETGVTVREGEIFTESFKQNIDGVDMYLNGEPYDGSTITMIGNYTFTIKGVRGYEKSWNFIIRNVIDQVDGDVLEEATDLDYDVLETYINDELVPNDYRITDTGTFHVLLVGAGGYNHDFTVSFTNENVALSKYFNYAAFSLTGVLGVTYLFLLRRRFK